MWADAAACTAAAGTSVNTTTPRRYVLMIRALIMHEIAHAGITRA
jgi:hypothetical protein